MIKAFRADDRLIHGQVQTQWISTYGVNRVMIIDRLQRMRHSLPPGLL